MILILKIRITYFFSLCMYFLYKYVFSIDFKNDYGNTIKNYYEQNYVVNDIYKMYYKYEAYFRNTLLDVPPITMDILDQLSEMDDDDLLPRTKYGMYKKNKFRNYKVENGIIKNIYNNPSYKNKIDFYEFYLPIHIELINQIKFDLKKVDDEFDFLLISLPTLDRVNEDNICKYIYTAGEKYKIYFIFHDYKSITIYKPIHICDDVISFLLCIKKNTYASFSTYLYELLRKNKVSLDYTIKKLESGVDYFTQKEFYKEYQQKLKDSKLVYCEMGFNICNYNKKLYDYYFLGFHLNLTYKGNLILNTESYICYYLECLKQQYYYSEKDYFNTSYKKSQKQYEIMNPFYYNAYLYIPSRLKCYFTKYTFLIKKYIKIFFLNTHKKNK